MRITILIAVALPLAAWAADDIKPLDVKTGLWETTSNSQITGMPAVAMPQIPEDVLAKMSPEQRARVEAMMKSRGGPGAMHSVTTKACLTKESLSHPLSMVEPQKNCTHKLISSTASRQQIHIECTPDKQKFSGDLTVERLDSEHVKGTALIKAEGDTPISSKINFETKWLSSDCGNVKPVGAK